MKFWGWFWGLVLGGPAVAFVAWALDDNAKLFLTTAMNGLTLAALYFLVASGFTLVFGLMRNVNLAHGSLYLLGAYVGWVVGENTGSWLLAVAAGFLSAAVVGLLMQVLIFRFMEGQDLRQTLVTIGLSIVFADLMLWWFGGEIYTFDPPAWIYGSTVLPVVEKFPTYRIAVLLAAIVIGIGLWSFLSKTRVGMMIRAGVDDRQMVSALGVNIQLTFAIAFAVGSALAGFGGALGGSFASLGPGVDGNWLLYSLVVVIIGGMGSLAGAAVGALLLGLVSNFSSAYLPGNYTFYSIIFTFVLLAIVLAFRPLGLFGRPA